jgi:hypothetical protein
VLNPDFYKAGINNTLAGIGAAGNAVLGSWKAQAGLFGAEGIRNKLDTLQQGLDREVSALKLNYSDRVLGEIYEYAADGAGLALGGVGASRISGSVTDIDGLAGAVERWVPNSVERVSSRPEWLQRLDAGNAFNAERSAAYLYNEVYIDSPKGSGYTRLDSYNPSSGEIVSRKFTQLSDVQEKTAIGYINELPSKYPVNGTVANVPSSRGLAGQPLLGQHYLEVPVQVRPVPQSVIDAADRAGVLIRDVNGKIY